MSIRAVVALGGNALGDNAKEQQEKMRHAAPSIVELISKGYEIVISHGNGPQVGAINLAFSEGEKANPKVPHMDLPECNAMSQGYIGYHLQNGIQAEVRKRGAPWTVATVITRMEVDKDDPAFKDPVKPIGSYYTKEQAENLMKQNPKLYYADDAGRGYRQMVASPKPKDIIEKDAILNLIHNEFIVIACGGGGIPVVKKGESEYEGVNAVIDKDFASAKLAELIEADYLFIFTAVDFVSINWGKPNQKDLKNITVQEAEKYCEEGQFAPGSMLPKVKAAINFAKSKKGRKSIICSLEKAALAIDGKIGTQIYL